jgi:hypothetical protein
MSSGLKKKTVSIPFSPVLSYHFGHGLGGCTVGTTTGISAEIVEAVVPQTSSPNPAKMPIVVYAYSTSHWGDIISHPLKQKAQRLLLG